MAKIVLKDITTGYNISRINENFEDLEDELQNKVLYRDNPIGEPNSMNVDLDMDSNDILNAGNIDAASFTINGDQDPFSSAQDSAAAAAASAVDSANSASDSAQSASDAFGFAQDASGYADNAQASAEAAQAVVEGVNWRDVINKNTDVTVTVDDGGVLYNIDSTSGDIDVYLPSIALVPTTFSISVRKTSSDTNTVTLIPDGTDTIGGDTGYAFSNQGQGITVVSDESTTPDDWAILEFNKGLADNSVTIPKLTVDAKPYDITFEAGVAADGTLEDVAVQVYVRNVVMTRSGTFNSESGYCETAPTGANLIIDVKKNGTTIYTSLPYIAAGANALTNGTLKSDGSEDFVEGDRIRFEITQVGSTVAGQGLGFSLAGYIT